MPRKEARAYKMCNRVASRNKGDFDTGANDAANRDDADDDDEHVGGEMTGNDDSQQIYGRVTTVHNKE